MNDVTDYVLALLANKRPREVLIEELSVFMNDYAQDFVERLLERIGNDFYSSSSLSCTNAEEIEVDFEEDESIASASERGRSSILAGRRLREYSPSRPDEQKHPKVFSDAQEAKAKVPCANFQKFGKCRYGDTCHFAHVAPRTSRLRLEALPVELQNPEALVQAFKHFGSILAVHVETAMATIQFSSPDEAEAALKCAVIVEPIKASLLQKERKQAPLKAPPSTLPELLELQKKQQTLLARCISDQKALFSELEAEDADDAVKATKMDTLSKLSSTCASVQQMLKSTTEMIIDAKNQQTLNRAAAPAQVRRTSSKFQHPFKAPSAHANRSLDLRPATLRLTDLSAVGPLRDIHALQRYFAPFGSILSLKVVESGEAAVVKYERHADAKKAYESITSSSQSEIITWEEQQ